MVGPGGQHGQLGSRDPAGELSRRALAYDDFGHRPGQFGDLREELVEVGLDVVKALALGAEAVLIGRAWAYAVAAAGQAGVEHVIDVLHEEMKVAMALTGACSVGELNPEVLREYPRL